jgi:hypothetical protein
MCQCKFEDTEEQAPDSTRTQRKYANVLASDAAKKAKYAHWMEDAKGTTSGSL